MGRPCWVILPARKKRNLDTVAEKAHPFTMVFQEPLDSVGGAGAETTEDLCILTKENSKLHIQGTDLANCN